MKISLRRGDYFGRSFVGAAVFPLHCEQTALVSLAAWRGALDISIAERYEYAVKVLAGVV
jgi:hypothetical protein